MKNLSQEKVITELRKVAVRFDPSAEKIKEGLILKISSQRLETARSILEYYDCMLFLLAYPQSKRLYALAEKELQHIVDAVKEVFEVKSERNKNQLTNTGITNSKLNVSFSFDLVKWLQEKFPDHISIFSCDADEDTIKRVFIAGLMKPEADRFREDSYSLDDFIGLLKPKTEDSDLKWLLNFVYNIPVSPEVRDHLYESLQIFVTIQLSDEIFPSIPLKPFRKKIFFQQKGVLKKFETEKVIHSDQFNQYSLSLEEKGNLISASRMTLCATQREIDPITYANAEEVELFDMGRGVDIALYPMIPERKLSIESYIGYMAFKNGIPIAYGGGWIYLFHSKIGINIFPALRGGESSWLFCQIIRLYHHYFNVKKFIVEPYQIGKNNKEGLQSGAYWFYYRLGFRSVQKELQELADKEFEKIGSKRNYRSPIKVMKRFTTSNLELNLAPDEKYPEENAATLSELLTNYINAEHEGQRTSEVPGSFRWKEGMSERDFILKLQMDSKHKNGIAAKFTDLLNHNP